MKKYLNLMWLIFVLFSCLIFFLFFMVEKGVLPWWFIGALTSVFFLLMFYVIIALLNDLSALRILNETNAQKDLEMEAKLQQQHLADVEEESAANRRILESMGESAKQMAKIFRPSKNPPETPENDS